MDLALKSEAVHVDQEEKWTQFVQSEISNDVGVDEVFQFLSS